MDIYTDMDTDIHPNAVECEVYTGYEDYAFGQRLSPGGLFDRTDGKYKIVDIMSHNNCHCPKGETAIVDGLGEFDDSNMIKWNVKAVKI